MPGRIDKGNQSWYNKENIRLMAHTEVSPNCLWYIRFARTQRTLVGLHSSLRRNTSLY